MDDLVSKSCFVDMCVCPVHAVDMFFVLVRKCFCITCHTSPFLISTSGIADPWFVGKGAVIISLFKPPRLP